MPDIIPEICSCLALRQATRQLVRLYDTALAPVGVGVNQFSILAKLAQCGPQSLQEFADRMVMDRSSLGHLLRPLEKRGLVSLSFSNNDKRRRVIALTGSGNDLLAKARILWERAETRFGALYGSDDAVALRIALKRVEVAVLEQRRLSPTCSTPQT